jgi:hypothetical protein
MIAVDTNVLIYACDQADPKRQKVALDLITNAEDGVLLWQVACEFISASRKLHKQGFTSTTPGIVSPSSEICCLWFCPVTAFLSAPRNFISCGKRRFGTP